jgi:tRNA (pseudouridine54-N1)-methyltransferase
MDVVCRCLTSALLLSYSLRRDTQFYVVLNGPPKPPVSLCFDTEKLKTIFVSERKNAHLIKTVLSEKFDDKWKETDSGIMISKKSFQSLIKELKNKPIYVLHEKGKSIGKIEIEKNPVFIVGDHIGLPKKEEKFVLRYAKDKISLGKKSYLASSCITIMNWFCDLRGI